MTAGRHILAVMLTCSCAEPLTIRMSDRIKVLPEPVAEACDFWGIACELSGRLYGSVKVSLVEVQAGETVLGDAWGADSCRPGFVVDPTSRHRVAHELGHVLIGPEHSDDPDNVMWHSGADDAEATDAQLDAAERGADRIVGCR